jgi:selenide,water dikinase
MFPIEDYPALLVGLAEPDDSAVYRVSDEQAIISTVDFFPPVVDDPYAFGAIAAANALSDVYAMGGEPLMAINLAAFPDSFERAIITEILRGGAEKVREAGAVIAGGHTVTDKEPKYGLAVTGSIHPDRIKPKGGAKPGDVLILTKALGTGAITTALKNSKAQADHVAAAIASMSRLNCTAARAANLHNVHGMTDITGYSLLGHAHEMAHLASADFVIHVGALEWLPGALDYARQDIFPGGMRRNQQYFSQWVTFDPAIDESIQGLLYDPQTSGGLLMSLPAERAALMLDDLHNAGESAAIIGEVVLGSGHLIIQS